MVRAPAAGQPDCMIGESAVGVQEPRRLRRSADGILGGVASGLGEYLGIDPVVVRLVLACAALTGGTGVVVYGLIWACVPAPGSRHSPAELLLTRAAAAPGWVQGYLAVVLGLLVLDGVATGGSGLVVGLGLIGLGVVLFRRDAVVASSVASSGASSVAASGASSVAFSVAPAGAPLAPSPPPAPPAPSAAAPPPWPEPVLPGARAAWPSATAGGTGGPARQPWPVAAGWDEVRSSRAGRAPSLLGRATFGLIVLALGAAALADLAGLVQLSATRMLAVALSVVGIGLVIGTWWGRSRGLLALGLVVLAALTGLALVDAVRSGGIGGRVERPASLDLVRERYDLLAGLSVVDLSRVEFDRTPTAVTASVGVGRLVVIVPADVNLDIDGHVRAGDLLVPGEYAAGLDVLLSAQGEGEPEGGRLALDLRAGTGSVVVRRADAEGALP